MPEDNYQYAYKTSLQRISKLLKKVLPAFIMQPLRNIGTAFITPIRFSCNSGHFRSSLKNKALDRHGNVIPWYAYPAIDFIKNKDFKTKRILEFGAGQSTIWWAERSNYIKSFEEDKIWYKTLKKIIPVNVDLIYTDRSVKKNCLDFIEAQLKADEKYDLIIIDGLFRQELCKIAIAHLVDQGCIIADNSEGGGYNYQAEFKDKGFSRVDFFGHAPGVVLKQGTSFFFKNNSFIVNNDDEIENVL